MNRDIILENKLYKKLDNDIVIGLKRQNKKWVNHNDSPIYSYYPLVWYTNVLILRLG